MKMNGGLFEKIIAKMIGGIAEGIFDLTTNETFGVGFKQYDELIFGKTDNDLAPFTEEQWNNIVIGDNYELSNVTIIYNYEG